MLIVSSCFYPKGTLSHSRQNLVKGESLGDSVGKAQTFESGSSQDNSMEILCLKFSKTGVNISSQRHQFNVRVDMEQLCPPSEAAGAHSCLMGKLIKGLASYGDKDVSRIFSLGKGGKYESVRQFGRYVFHTVDGHVHPFI